MKPDAFFTLFSGLPRQGPGSTVSTLHALRLLPQLPPAPRVFDMGCGTGRQTLVLARALRTRVVAVDTHQPFLEELARNAQSAGLAERIETRCVSMDALQEPAESIQLIWSEGAAYILGVARALRVWRPLLVAGGLLAFTEASWLIENPPAEVADFWKREYPEIAGVQENCARAQAEGYEILDTFVLPASDWWEEYYTPLQQRIAALRPEAANWPELAQVIAGTEQEIDMFARHEESYGYVFYLLRKPTK